MLDSWRTQCILEAIAKAMQKVKDSIIGHICGAIPYSGVLAIPGVLAVPGILAVPVILVVPGVLDVPGVLAVLTGHSQICLKILHLPL